LTNKPTDKLWYKHNFVTGGCVDFLRASYIHLNVACEFVGEEVSAT